MKRNLNRIGAFVTAAVMTFSTFTCTTASARIFPRRPITQNAEDIKETSKIHKLKIWETGSYYFSVKKDIDFDKECYAKTYIYDEDLKKYVLHSQAYSSSIHNLRPNTKYKVLIKYVQNDPNDTDNNGNVVYKTMGTVKTFPGVKLVNNGKTCNVSLYVDKGEYDGVEFYTKNSYTTGTSAQTLDESKLIYRTSKQDPADVSFKIKNTVPKETYIFARLYKIKNGKKTDFMYTDAQDIADARGLANNIKLGKSNITTSGEELDLVKYYVDQWVKDDMTNEEKLYAIYNGVYQRGYYTDIYKINGNRPVWQIMVKQEGQCATWAFALYHMLEYAGFDARVIRGLRGTQQHFWTEIDAGNGKWIAVDAHLGGMHTANEDHSLNGYIPQEYMG